MTRRAISWRSHPISPADRIFTAKQSQSEADTSDLDEYDFVLPRALIAQRPARPRDGARLLRIGREGLEDRLVNELPHLLDPGDIVVVNDTRVIAARFAARRGAARIGLTLDRPDGDVWHAIAQNARRLRPGDVLAIENSREGNGSRLTATILDREGAFVRLCFSDNALAARAGVLALPPYIVRAAGLAAEDDEDYQTAFATEPGAVAAPTAGLHFTPALLDALRARGVSLARVTLHVGAGTFLPVRTSLAAHEMHAERGLISPEAAAAINAARARGGRVVAVGTTSLRLLETASDASGTVRAWGGETTLFIRPGHAFRTAEMLLTNFHLPRSTLLVLVCAFAGIARIRDAYRHAIESKYRFYSYGDACLIDRTLDSL